MYSRYRTYGISALFMMADVLTLTVVFHASVLIRHCMAPWLGSTVGWAAVKPLADVGTVLIIAVFLLYGLYPGYGLASVKELERTIRAWGVVFLGLAAFFYLNKSLQSLPRSLLVLAGGMAFWLLPLERLALRRWLSQTRWYGVPVVVYGQRDMAKDVSKILQRMPRLGWRTQGVVPLERVGERPPLSRRTPIALLALSAETDPVPYARALAQWYPRVVLIRDHGHFGSLWVEAHDLSGKLGLEFRYHLLAPFNRWVKRTADIVGAALLVIVLAPFLAFVAIWIKIDSPGPVLFRQRRYGKDGRIFEILKFRTMVVDAEEKLQEILARDPQLREEYERHRKLRYDPRVTRVGRWLRKFSLDELPQLFNVLRGHMSLVGPRAYIPAELQGMKHYPQVISRVRPGMTGWWQVQGRHHTTFQKRLEMDEYYISNWSLWMDMFILLKTVWVVISGQGT